MCLCVYYSKLGIIGQPFLDYADIVLTKVKPLTFCEICERAVRIVEYKEGSAGRLLVAKITIASKHFAYGHLTKWHFHLGLLFALYAIIIAFGQ